jgi:hypothetical protein
LLQAGVQSSGLSLVGPLSMYAAVDVKWKQEVSWGSTQSFQVGVRFDPGGAVRISLAYTHRRGFEERGQVFDRKRTDNLLTIAIDR